MESVLYIFAKLVAITLDAVSLAMLARMLLPLFLNAEENKIYIFLVYITEPFIIPVRYFMVKFNFMQDSPIDWSFTFSYILLTMVRFMLPLI